MPNAASARTTFIPRTTRLAVLAAVGAAVALAGCTQSVDEASTDYCSSIETLEGELDSLGSLVSGDATPEEIQAQREAVSEAFDASSEAAGDLEESVSGAANAANEAFQDAVDAIPDDASLIDTARQYTSAAQQYLASLATIAADAGCEPTPT